MSAQKIDTTFQSEQYKTRETIEKIDFNELNSIMNELDRIVDENKIIMKQFITNKDSDIKTLYEVNERVTIKNVIDNNNIILGKKPNNIVTMQLPDDPNADKNTLKKQKYMVSKINVIDYTAIERKKNKYEYKLYQNYLKNIKRIQVEKILQEQEFMAKFNGRLTLVKLAGTGVAVGISLLLITSITNPIIWIQMGQNIINSPFLFQIFTDIFYNFGIFNISDVENVKNLFEMYNLSSKSSELLKNKKYINILISLIFRPYPLSLQNINELNNLYPNLNINEFIKTKNLNIKDIKPFDLLNILNNEFPEHTTNNSISKLFLTINTILNKKNIFDPSKKVLIDQGWFTFASSLYTSAYYSYFLTFFNLAYNVNGYINTTQEILQNSQNINPNILFKGLSENALNSMSFINYINIFNTNLIKNIVGNKLNDVFISTALIDLTGKQIEGFFITSLNSLIQIEATSRIKGYFKKIEDEAEYISLEERIKNANKIKKDPVVEMEIEIRNIGKLAEEGLTNEQIVAAINSNDSVEDYKFFGFKYLNIFYKKFSQLKNNPGAFMYSLANVSVIYNLLQATFYPAIFGASFWSLQKLVLTGWADYVFYKLKKPIKFEFTFLNVISEIITYYYGSDQVLKYKINKIRNKIIKDIIQDLQTLTIKISNIFYDSRIGMSFQKYLYKINNTILGSLFTTSCKVVFNIILLPQINNKLYESIPMFQINISEFIKDSSKVVKFFTFTNHRISNIITLFNRNEFSSNKLLEELKLFSVLESFINNNYLPYIAANKLYAYDELNISKLPGCVIRILNNDGVEKYKTKLDRIISDENVEKSYIVVEKNLDDDFIVIDLNDITDKINKNKNGVKVFKDTEDTKNTNDIFYKYYYTQFITYKKSINKNYIFNLEDFKEFIINKSNEIRKNYEGKLQMSYELGIINNVMLTITEKFNSNVWSAMGRDLLNNTKDIKYNNEIFSLLDSDKKNVIENFFENPQKLQEITLKKQEIMSEKVITTIFTPNTYGWLPQTIRGKDFYSFRHILSLINNSSLTSDVEKQLDELEVLASQDYNVARDLAILNNDFKTPFKFILQNLYNLDDGFIEGITNKSVNLPLKDLGFDYLLFQENIKKLPFFEDFNTLLNHNSPYLTDFFVQLLDIKGIDTKDDQNNNIKKLINILLTPEMLFKIATLTSDQIRIATNTISNKYSKEKILPDNKIMNTSFNILKNIVNGTIVNNETITIFDIIINTINEQNTLNNEELNKLKIILKTMVPKMSLNNNIKLAIESYFQYTNSPIDEINKIVNLNINEFNNLFKSISDQISEVNNTILKENIQNFIDKDNLDKLDLMFKGEGIEISIDDIKGYFTSPKDIELLNNYGSLILKLKNYKTILLKQQTDFSLLSNNTNLYEYKRLREDWLNICSEIYFKYRQKLAGNFYSEIYSKQRNINNQIETNIQIYRQKLNAIYNKYIISKNNENKPRFKNLDKTPEQDFTRDQKQNKASQKRQGQLPQVREQEFVKEQVQNKVKEQQEIREEVSQEVSEEIGEEIDEDVSEKISEDYDISFGGDMPNSFFGFFADMHNKLGSPNINDSSPEIPSEVTVTQPENKEKNAEEICENVSGKWGIYQSSVTLYDTSIDIQTAKRCNDTNYGQKLFDTFNLYYTQIMSGIKGQTIYGSIFSLCMSIILFTKGAASAFLGIITSICAIGMLSPQGAILVIHYVFLTTFQNSFGEKLTDQKPLRNTNIGIKILFSIWYRFYKSFLNLYKDAETNEIDYEKICRDTLCNFLKGLPTSLSGLDVRIDFKEIDTFADSVMSKIYDSDNLNMMQIDIEDYNVNGDIDLGQKTNGINTSSMKNLLTQLSVSNFLDSEMEVNYNLITNKSKEKTLQCSDLTYNIINFKLAIYNFIKSTINSNEPMFYYEFFNCAITGRMHISGFGDAIKILWHLVKNPNILKNIFIDFIIIIIGNQNLRPFLLTLLFGKESKFRNINFVRDIIDNEIQFLVNKFSDDSIFDQNGFEEKIRDSLNNDFVDYFIAFNDLFSKIFNTIKSQFDEKQTEKKEKKMIYYDNFIICYNNNLSCKNLKDAFMKYINDVNTNVFNGDSLLNINVSNLNNDTLNQIKKIKTDINVGKITFKDNITDTEERNIYLNNLNDVLNKYKIYIEKQIELENFLKTKLTSGNAPFLNFPLQNYLDVGFNKQSAVKEFDLIFVCQKNEVLIYNNVSKQYVCKNIDVLNIDYDYKKYEDIYYTKRELLLNETFGYIKQIIDINVSINTYCDDKWCSEDDYKKFEKKFSIEKLSNLGNETTFEETQTVLKEYKTNVKNVIKSFEINVNNQLKKNKELISFRENELINAKTEDDIETLKSNILLLENEINKFNKILEEINVINNKVDNINLPNDIGTIQNFDSYVYNKIFKSEEAKEDPNLFAFTYLLKLGINYTTNLEDLIKIYDVFSSDQINLNESLSNGKQLKLLNPELNKKLNSKEVKEYIKNVVGKYILLNANKNVKYLNKRNNNMFIKDSSKNLIEIKDKQELLSALTGTKIEDIRPFDVLYNYGYFLHKDAGPKSSLTLSKCWSKDKKFSSQNALINYIINKFGEDDKDYYKYNDEKSFDDNNKFTDAIPSILHNFNIDTVQNEIVKKFVKNNYELINDVWIFKPDLELYNSTFKGFQKSEFAVSINAALLKKKGLFNKYFKEQTNKEKEIKDLELQLNAAKKEEKELIKEEKQIEIEQKQNEMENEIYKKIKNLLEQVDDNIEDVKKDEINRLNGIISQIDSVIQSNSDNESIKQYADDAKNEIQLRIDKYKNQIKEEEEEEKWKKKSYFEKAKYYGKKTYETIKSFDQDNVKKIVDNFSDKIKALKTYENLDVFKNATIKNIKNALNNANQNVSNLFLKITENSNNLWYGSFSEDDIKYVDQFVGVQFEYLNNLEVTVNNPFGLRIFSDFYQGNIVYNQNEIYNPFYDQIFYLSNYDIQKNNFKIVFNSLFSPNVFSIPLSNMYYDVNSQQLLYNIEGVYAAS